MSYKIELIPSGISGARNTMFRCGVKFQIGEAQILDLTDEQAEAFKNDWRFKTTDSKDSGEKIAGGAIETSQTIPPTEGIFTEEIVVDKTKTVKNKTVTQEEIIYNENEQPYTLKELLKDHSREELDQIANDLNIKNPENFSNKSEVAKAIVDAQ